VAIRWIVKAVRLLASDTMRLTVVPNYVAQNLLGSALHSEGVESFTKTTPKLPRGVGVSR